MLSILFTQNLRVGIVAGLVTFTVVKAIKSNLRVMMVTYVYRNGQVIDKRIAPPLHESGAAPNVISDIMDPTRHMANGKYYTSKSRFREATKDAGCVEIGNDSALYKPRKPIPLSREKRREDIKRTIYELRNR